MPTRRTIPPRISGSTTVVSSIVLPGLLSDPVADALDGRGVELDGARDLDRQQPLLVIPQLLEAAADPEDRRHPMSLDQRLEEVHQRRIGAAEHSLQAVLLLLVEKYGEKKKTAVS